MNRNRIHNKPGSGFANHYLAKSTSGKIFTEVPPGKNLKYSVVIPAFNESGLLQSLDSLFRCNEIDRDIEILTVINFPYDCDRETIDFNLRIRDQAVKWSELHNSSNKKFLFITIQGKDKKNSGVGFARKTGMDEAIFRFNTLGYPDGIILSLDADAVVDRDYFQRIDQHFKNCPDTDGCSIYFEHPLEGKLEKKEYEAIAQYELHQRYYVESLRFSGHPNVFHTVGSAFAVKAETYCKQGGMNKRQGGEDFYFLQKIFDLGNFSECNSTRVIPSARSSDRVPFGTGPAVIKYINDEEEIKSNNPELFKIIKEFLDSLSQIYDSTRKNDFNFMNSFHPLLRDFLIENKFEKKIKEIYDNSSGPGSFMKRFFRWFNMFRVLKFLNYGKQVFPDVPVIIAASELLKKMEIQIDKERDTKKYLRIFREIQRKN